MSNTIAKKIEEKKGMEAREKFLQGKKEAADRYKERQAAAKNLIIGFVNSKPDLPSDVLEAMTYLAGAGKAARVSKPGVNDTLKNLFLEQGSVSAIEIFEKFEFGRPTMEQKIRTFIKGEDKIWVAFENGNYVLKGEGDEAPEGWTGYVPVVKADETIL